MRPTRLVSSALLALFTLSLAPLTPAFAAPPTGSATSIPATPGKARGSDAWGFVGDIEVRAGSGLTFPYGIQFSPTTDELVVSDSGKVAWNRLQCLFGGYSSAPCQLGTPRVFSYRNLVGRAGTGEGSLGDYLVDGTYSANATVASSAGVNSGIGKKYQSTNDRTVYTYPNPDGPNSPNIKHGPRGVTFTSDGTAWVVDSEAVSPRTGPGSPSAISRFGPQLTPLPGAGYTGTWAQRDEPGVHLYRVGAATTPQDTVLVDSEVSNRLQEYRADGTWIRSMLLDVPATPEDPGYRNPYSVAVDPVDGAMYISLVNFRDGGSYWQNQDAYLEKRDKDGNIIATLGQGYLPRGQVVFGAAVEPKNRHVFVWSQFSDVFEFTKDGAFVRSYTSAEFPGLTQVRGLTFDTNGRMYFTVAEGTTNARVMILGKTPNPITDACGQRSADGTSMAVTWDCATTTNGETPYQQTPVRDYVIEQHKDGDTDGNGNPVWTVVPKAAASTAKTRTITGLDPAAQYSFRVSAWNEAGNGDWSEITVSDYKPADDRATTPYGTPVTVSVLTNDTPGVKDTAPTSINLLDTDGKPVTNLTTPQGTYTVSNKDVIFTPAAGYSGTTPAVTVQSRTPSGCTLTSTLTVQVSDPAHLTLTVEVQGGTAVGTDWTVSASGPTPISGRTGEAAVTQTAIGSGSYTLAAGNGPQGYNAGAWRCSTASGSPISVITPLTIKAGDEVTCIVTFTASTPTATSTPTVPTVPTVTPDSSPRPSLNGTNGRPLPGTGSTAAAALALSVTIAAIAAIAARSRKR